MSRKCRLAFTDPHFDLTSYPRAVSRVFLYDLMQENNTNGAKKIKLFYLLFNFFYKSQPNLHSGDTFLGPEGVP